MYLFDGDNMNEEELLFKRRNYLLAYINTKEIDENNLEDVKKIIEKYNNGYVRHQNFKSRDWHKGIPKNLEWQLIIFGVHGEENIRSLIKEAKEYNIKIGEYKEVIE